MDIFKRAMKPKWDGKGGWKCSCCVPKNKDKPVARRYARRVLKQEQLGS